MHAENRKKDVLILDKGLADGLDGMVLAIEAEYNINFRKQPEQKVGNIGTVIA